MALFLKDNPVGIDRKIDRIQRDLFSSISWNKAPLTDNDYNSYHRVYVNPDENRGGKLIPEIFVSGNDYQSSYYNDNFSAESFFLVSENRPFTDQDSVIETDLSIIFQLNLRNTYPNITHRADEEAHREVALILQDLDYIDMKDLVINVDNVYKGLDVSKERRTDMHPCHVFRFDVSTSYEYTCY